LSFLETMENLFQVIWDFDSVMKSILIIQPSSIQLLEKKWHHDVILLCDSIGGAFSIIPQAADGSIQKKYRDLS
jgi:hypothetical protein